MPSQCLQPARMGQAGQARRLTLTLVHDNESAAQSAHDKAASRLTAPWVGWSPRTARFWGFDFLWAIRPDQALRVRTLTHPQLRHSARPATGRNVASRAAAAVIDALHPVLGGALADRTGPRRHLLSVSYPPGFLPASLSTSKDRSPAGAAPPRAGSPDLRARWLEPRARSLEPGTRRVCWPEPLGRQVMISHGCEVGTPMAVLTPHSWPADRPSKLADLANRTRSGTGNTRRGQH